MSQVVHPMRFLKFFLLIVVLLTLGLKAYSHQNHHKTDHEESADEKLKLEHINTMYSQSVKPLFENKCLVCHGGPPKFPWYHRLPLAKQLLDHDVKEGKKHLDISSGFPFKGHASPIDDLRAIKETMNKKSMPPARYWIIHWKCRLTEKERQTIIDWTTQSLEILEQK